MVEQVAMVRVGGKAVEILLHRGGEEWMGRGQLLPLLLPLKKSQNKK